MDEECRSENSYEPSIAEDDEWQEVAPIGLNTGFSFDGIAGESLFGVASFEEGAECSLEHVQEVTGNQVFQLQQILGWGLDLRTYSNYWQCMGYHVGTSFFWKHESCRSLPLPWEIGTMS